MKRSGPMNYQQLEKHISEQFLLKRRRLAGTMEVGTSSSSTPVAKGEQGHYKSQDEGVFRTALMSPPQVVGKQDACRPV